MTMKKKAARAAGALAVGILLASGSAVAAEAAVTYSITGMTNTGGHVVDYHNYRPHSPGPITLRIDAGVTNGARYMMRNKLTGATTGWSETLHKGNQRSWNTRDGSYAVSAKQNSCSFAQKFACVNIWRGTLTL